MTIRDISVDVFTRDVPTYSTAPPRFKSAGKTHYMALVRVTTEDGLEGYSFLGPTDRYALYSLCHQILGFLRKELLGKSVTEREWLWTQLGIFTPWWGQITYPAWAALDVALWDVTGKKFQAPIYQLLGVEKKRVLGYVSSPYYPEVEEYVDEARLYQSRGVKGYKIHPAGAPLCRVKEICRRVREAVGEEMLLMLDAALCYDYRDALEIGKYIQGLGFVWYEDPVAYNDLDALDELARRLEIPLAVSDHPEFRFREAAQLIRRNSGVRIIRGGSAKEGITGLKKLCSLCEGFGLNCEILCAKNSLMNMANIHVALSAVNCEYAELIVPADIVQYGMSQDVQIDAEGFVEAPEEPGLGLVIDWDVLRSAHVETLR